MPLLEAVPNISEGRNRSLIEQVGADFCCGGAQLLRIDSHQAAHRSVFTLVGEAQQLIDGAQAAAQRCMTDIDLRCHKGIHPRMGALDVFPVVALCDDDKALAQQTAQAIGVALSDLGLPVYFYEHSATTPQRKWLREVRARGFEHLAQRMLWDAPDLGPQTPHPTAGAVAVGARELLIAFNLSLSTSDVRSAHKIAAKVREFSKVTRDSQGRAIHRKTDGLPGVRAIGWFSEDHNCAQVSTNLTDFRITAPHTLLRKAQELAARLDTTVVRTELVGCIPRAALFAEITDSTVTTMTAAAQKLLLHDFDAQQRVLEVQLKRRFPEAAQSVT